MTYTPYSSGQQATQIPENVIVIVEDDSSNAEVLNLLLQATGPFQTLCFRDGNELLNHLAIDTGLHPKLFLLDYTLPHMTALTLYARLQSLDGFERIPAIILTAHSEIALEKQVGGQEHLTLITKPYDIDALLALIQELAG